jgi:hypothetical protein
MVRIINRGGPVLEARLTNFSIKLRGRWPPPIMKRYPAGLFLFSGERGKLRLKKIMIKRQRKKKMSRHLNCFFFIFHLMVKLAKFKFLSSWLKWKVQIDRGETGHSERTF